MLPRLALVALVLTPFGASGELRFPQTRTTLVRFQGTWGPPQPGHVAAADLELEHGKVTARMQVETARVLMGDRSGPDVLAEASGRRPSFRLRGPRELLTRLDGARPGQHVEIAGYLRSGSPELELTAVTLGDAKG